MGPTDRDHIPEIADEQGGVFTAHQALAEGWTPRQIRRRLTNGRWVHVAGRGLAVPPGDRSGWSAYQLSIAAQLTIPSAVTSHLTAAVLHRFPVAVDARSHITTTRITRAPSNMVLHRATLEAGEVQTMDGFAMITSPSRTAVDCLAMMNLEEQLRLWAWVSSRDILSAALLDRFIAERFGHRGNAGLRNLLGIVGDGAVSVAEQLCHQILRAAGLIGWSAGVSISDDSGIIGVVDILFARHRLVIEVDGFSAHSSRSAFIDDRRRQNRLVAAGYTVLRFSWDDLKRHPDDVAERIRASLKVLE